MALRRNVGAQIAIPAGIDPFVFLFAESTARVLVAVAPDHEERFTRLCAHRNLAIERIGTTLAVSELNVDATFTVELAELRAASAATLPALFG